MKRKAAPQRGVYFGDFDSKVWTGLRKSVLVTGVLAVVLPIALIVLLFVARAADASRLQSGPPVKNVTFNANTLAMVLPSEFDADYLRILVIDGRPTDQCHKIELSATSLGTTDILQMDGRPYDIIGEWLGASQEPISSHGSEDFRLRVIGGVGMRMAIKTGWIAEPSATLISRGNCSVVVFTGANEAYLAPVVAKPHIKELRN